MESNRLLTAERFKELQRDRADLIAALRMMVEAFKKTDGDIRITYEEDALLQATTLLRRLDRESLTGKRDGS